MNIRTDFDCVHEGLSEKAVNYFSQSSVQKWLWQQWKLLKRYVQG